MREELLDKEVICLLDTRQIQKYIFRSNSYMATLGGNDLIKGILEEAIEHALASIDPPLKPEEYDLSKDPDVERIPYFVSDKIKFQIFDCSAGNAIFLVRTGALAQKIIRKISCYYRDHAYSLNLSVAATEMTGDQTLDMFNLYQKLDVIKASSDILDPQGPLPVIMREPRTGDPIVAYDDRIGAYVSRASQLRISMAERRGSWREMKDMRTTTGSDGREYLAMYHIDGNNMGITISKITQVTPDYEKGILRRRRISSNIRTKYTEVLNKTIQELEDYYVSIGGKREEFCEEFELIHQGGDDLNCMSNANLAAPFLHFLFKNLEGRTFWDDGKIRAPLCMCAGVAFVTPQDDFHSTFMLAEECCDNAKKVAKTDRNLRDGYAGNWMDFQVCADASAAQHLELLRERVYTADNGISLMLRPYCFDKEVSGTAYAWDELLRRVRTFRELPLDDQDMERMRRSYSMGTAEFTRWVRHMKKNGTDLEALLGKALYRGEDGDKHAVWFDTVEFAQFMPGGKFE